MTYRFIQCVNAIVFKYFNGHCPDYLDEVFQISIENNFQSRVSFQNFPFHKTNTGQLALSYSCPIIWNKHRTHSSVLKIVIPSNIIQKIFLK